MVNAREQLPTEISEVDFGGRMKWISGYVAQIETVEAFGRVSAECRRMDDRLAGLQQGSQGVVDLATASTERLKLNPFNYNYAEAADKITESSLPILSNLKAFINDARVPIAHMRIASERNARVFKVTDEREQNLGNQMRNIPPATYVTQAIGQNHPVIDTRWTQVRAQIELFRHLTGQTNPEVTLGQPCDEEWAVHARKTFIFNIGRIQVSQVMLGPDCEQSAAGLGIGRLLDICGQPPLLSEEEIGRQLEQAPKDTWTFNARGVIADIERPYL